MTPHPVPDRRRRSVALIGLRGAGKTAIGRELAALLQLPFVDTDAEVERTSDRTIAEIFLTEGEPVFRRLEAEVIRTVVAAPPSVISVGGGAVLDPENVSVLRRVAVVVWLSAPVEVLWQRVVDDPSSDRMRPPLTDRSGVAELRELLIQREPLYRAAADLIIDTSGALPNSLAQKLGIEVRALTR